MKIIIKETQLNTLLKKNQRDYIFELCTTTNGRYLIAKDYVFDLQEHKNIGNIWDSLDIFKTIFKNTEVNNPEYKKIQKNIAELPINESNNNLYELRDILLEFNFFQDTWLGKELKSSGKSVKNFFSDSYEGLKKFGVSISKGDWKEILGLLAKGTKYFLRSLKSALYSPIGMILDAMLIATGIGKSVQWIPWALVLSLDIYQIAFNDWSDDEKNKPEWAKWLDVGFDVLGLAFAGAVAKSAKASIAGVQKFKNTRDAAKWLAKNPRAAAIIDKIINAASKVPSYLQKAIAYLQKTFPSGAKFIQGILGNANNAMNSMINSLKGLKVGIPKALSTAGKGARSGAVTGGLVYGVHKGSEYLFGNKEGAEIDALDKNYVKADFDSLSDDEI